jgi:chemotaxis signal transduction protein
MREAFDRTFAAAASPEGSGHSDVLCVGIGGEPCSIRIGDIASLHAGLRIIALPSRASELLGVAAIRANVIPIYDLAAALALPGAGAARWIVVHRAGLAGFAFEHFEGHVRIPEGSMSVPARRGHVVGQLALGAQRRLVIDLGSVLTAIESRCNPGAAKEP